MVLTLISASIKSSQESMGLGIGQRVVVRECKMQKKHMMMMIMQATGVVNLCICPRK